MPSITATDDKEPNYTALTVAKNGSPADKVEVEGSLDDLLRLFGHFGKLQKRVLFAAILASISVAYQNVCPVFTLNTPNYRCKIPDLANDTYAIQAGNSHLLYVNHTIPVDDDGAYSQCYVYGVNSYEDVTSNLTLREQVECNEWVYDKSVFIRTVTTDLNLVCGNTIMRSHSNMLIFAGKFFGAIAQGFLSDRFGRRKVLIGTAFGVLVTAVGNAFVTNVASLFALRFLTGLMTTALYLAAFVLGIEFMDPGHRTVVSTTIGLSFALGQMAMTPLAYVLRDWRYLQLSLTWPVAVLVLIVWFIPESPRWLLSKNRREEAEEVLQRVSTINRVKLPDNLSHYLHLNQEHTREPAYRLFTDPRLLLRWTILYINWVVIAMVYYGLTLNVSNLTGNIFLNFFLTTLVDVIGKIVTGLLANRISRKYFHIFVMLLSGCACAAAFIPVLTESSHMIVVVLSLLGKLGISSAFYLIYIYTAELFPTTCRGLGMGSSSMIARLGGIVSPYIADLNTYVSGDFGQVLPQLVFGGSGIVGGLLVFLLPDTRGRKLPETIEDAKRFTDNRLPEKQEKNVVV